MSSFCLSISFFFVSATWCVSLFIWFLRCYSFLWRPTFVTYTFLFPHRRHHQPSLCILHLIIGSNLWEGGLTEVTHPPTHFHFNRPQLFILLMQHLASCWTLHSQSEEHDLHLHLFEVNLLWVFGPEIKVVKPLTLSTDKLRSLKIYLPVANLLKHSMIVIYAFRVVV